MSKIKINLTSGNVVEKPLVTAFKGTNGDYIVFDNETNGQMGYPVICISKINGANVEKIFDQSEWASVKENLKTIIAGTALPYLSVPETLTGNDDFYTQLTLPVASFDLLKSVYVAPAAPEAPAPDATVSMPEVAPTPEAPVESPIVTPDPTSLAPNPIVGAPTPVVPAQDPIMAAQVINNPVTPDAAPVMPENPAITEIPVASVTPEVPVAPANMDASVNNMGDDITTLKETFMKSCENMFDALVNKFQNK